MAEEIGPPVAKPTGDRERTKASFEEKAVVEGDEILCERAVRKIFADADRDFGRVEMAAIESEDRAAFVQEDAVSVDAVEGDAGGEVLKFPAGAEAGLAGGVVEGGEIKIFSHVDPDVCTQRGEDRGRDRAVEAHGGGLRSEVGLDLEGEGRAQEEPVDGGGELRERSGREVGHDRSRGETGGGKRIGRNVEFAWEELQAAGPERALDERADLECVGPERERDGIGGEVEPSRDGGVAEERDFCDDVEPVGLDGLRDSQLQAAGEEGDARDGDARFGGGEFELEGGLVEGLELGDGGRELAA